MDHDITSNTDITSIENVKNDISFAKGFNFYKIFGFSISVVFPELL